MHTNGLLLQRGSKSNLLEHLVDAGLTMVTFSIASFDKDMNGELMGVPQNPELLIKQALDLGLLVRCSLVVNKYSAPDTKSIMDYIYRAGNLGVHMIVIREVWIPENIEGVNEVLFWNRTNKIEISPIQREFIDIASNGYNPSNLQLRDPLPWGTPVFTIDGRFQDPDHGVNITFARCDEASTGQIFKSIVHKPNGHGYRNWDSNGDILY
jgi:MoaA/NifB/PqqE/SkfB family radical SAM enzyme